MSSNASIRVVHVFPNAARLSCGPCNAIMAFMECQRQHGLEVSAISPVDAQIPAGRRQPIEHLPIEEFDLATDNYCGLARARAEFPRTVFHFHGLSPWQDQIARALKDKAVPYVFTSHGQLHFHGPVHALKKFTYLNGVNPFIRAAAGLHFLTRRERERSRFILPWWRKPVLVQPNLVRLPNPDAIIPASRATAGIPPNAFVFAYLGRLDVQHKGLDFLVRAFAEVCRTANSRLLLIGPDFAGGQEFLGQLAQKLGCYEKIHFLGSLVGAAKWSALKMADAFVSPSRWEACSIAQAEAIGLGLPTIVSDQINIAPEMVAHQAALASPLSSIALARAMRQLMNDARLRQSLAAAGCRWVAETCSPEAAGARFEDFYRSVL
ncbi:MAG: glycosyltransferase family 4 protein [Verrucomicrobiae bacterium]|nr:glycosyltransferase family 4 protein [Verrucomicrobiae bacterium]